MSKRKSDVLLEPSTSSTEHAGIPTTKSAERTKFYNKVKKFVITKAEMVALEYPLKKCVPEGSKLKVRKIEPATSSADSGRTCSRCFTFYTVSEEGFALKPEICVFHPLNKRTIAGRRIYPCCKRSSEIGCSRWNTHVCRRPSSNPRNVEEYRVTLPPTNEDDDRSYDVFALDCEMCYTTQGLELCKVTVVNAKGETVYESIVKPPNPIIDCNTQFTGITKAVLVKTDTTIADVQTRIMELCNSNTILIGHGLDADLHALKIVHTNVIDTLIVYPHDYGLPCKRALRDLAKEVLGKTIQNNAGGHDSAEDARTCMELIRKKI